MSMIPTMLGIGLDYLDSKFFINEQNENVQWFRFWQNSQGPKWVNSTKFVHLRLCSVVLHSELRFNHKRTSFNYELEQPNVVVEVYSFTLFHVLYFRFSLQKQYIDKLSRIIQLGKLFVFFTDLSFSFLFKVLFWNYFILYKWVLLIYCFDRTLALDFVKLC